MQRRTRLALLGLALAVLFLSGDAVQAEPQPQPTPAEGFWVYDVRVVRVDTTTPEVVEVAPAWQADGKTTTDLSWKDLLASLGERGTTRIVLDQRVTAMPGTEVMVRDSRDRQIEQLQRRDKNNETWQPGNLSAGTLVKLRTTERLDYSVETKWDLARRGDDIRATLGTTSWTGAHPTLHGQTLHFTHRQQVAFEDGAPRGIEFYVFLTGRLQALE